MSDPITLLQREAQRWLKMAFQRGDISRNTVGRYSGDSFNYQTKGLADARRRLGEDFGERLANAAIGSSAATAGIVGLVADTAIDGRPQLVAQAYDLGSGQSLVAVQAYRKLLLIKRPSGEVQFKGPAEPLPFKPTDPTLKRFRQEISEVSAGVFKQRAGDISRAGLQMRTSQHKRGGERVMWDISLVVMRNGKQDQTPGRECPIWQDSSACLSTNDFAKWLNQKIDEALA